MEDKAIIPVEIKDLAENERLIFKLIFSVSERSRNRSHQYVLAGDNDDSSLLISGSADKPTKAQSRLVVQVCDRGQVSEGPAIQRPLIATRVLSALDQLVAEFGVLQENNADEITQVPKYEVHEKTMDYKETDRSDDENPGETVEFSISEAEASELAIVHDDSLANPANREEQETVEGATGTEAGVSADGLPKEETIRNKDVTSSYSSLSSQKIQTALVVDDSASVRKQLEIELELFEVSVDYAEDAERALDLLVQKTYDVAFLDVVLPDQDGFSICKKIKSDKDSKSTKVIMLTGKASHADKVRGSLAGCDAYMVKPVGRTTFQSTAKKFLKPVENIQVMEA